MQEVASVAYNCCDLGRGRCGRDHFHTTSAVTPLSHNCCSSDLDAVIADNTALKQLLLGPAVMSDSRKMHEPRVVPQSGKPPPWREAFATSGSGTRSRSSWNVFDDFLISCFHTLAHFEPYRGPRSFQGREISVLNTYVHTDFPSHYTNPQRGGIHHLIPKRSQSFHLDDTRSSSHGVTMFSIYLKERVSSADVLNPILVAD